MLCRVTHPVAAGDTVAEDIFVEGMGTYLGREQTSLCSPDEKPAFVTTCCEMFGRVSSKRKNNWLVMYVGLQ
ncbi:hypothetical protein HJFPF1_03559 [Paramyrothecium foliicola]|nr:hypothetical protein HJFPF1_03559 [Paramyrothecium foliicola]